MLTRAAKRARLEHIVVEEAPRRSRPEPQALQALQTLQARVFRVVPLTCTVLLYCDWNDRVSFRVTSKFGNECASHPLSYPPTIHVPASTTDKYNLDNLSRMLAQHLSSRVVSLHVPPQALGLSVLQGLHKHCPRLHTLSCRYPTALTKWNVYPNGGRRYAIPSPSWTPIVNCLASQNLKVLALPHNPAGYLSHQDILKIAQRLESVASLERLSFDLFLDSERTLDLVDPLAGKVHSLVLFHCEVPEFVQRVLARKAVSLLAKAEKLQHLEIVLELSCSWWTDRTWLNGLLQPDVLLPAMINLRIVSEYLTAPTVGLLNLRVDKGCRVTWNGIEWAHVLTTMGLDISRGLTLVAQDAARSCHQAGDYVIE